MHSSCYVFSANSILLMLGFGVFLLDYGTSGSSSTEDGNQQLNRGVVCVWQFIIKLTCFCHVEPTVTMTCDHYADTDL